MGFNPKANNISWKALESKQVIADGRFGKLEKATWIYFDSGNKKVEETVVIKKYKRSTTKLDVLDERDRINQWNHPNLCRLVGSVQTGRPSSVPWLVLEYLNMGDLRSYLMTTRRSGGLNAVRMSKLAHGIASGMDYLHSQGIVHGDLSCRNIVVNDKLSTVKINDFGYYDEKNNARFYMRYNQPNNPCPVRWMSPENLPFRVNRRGKLVEVDPKFSKDGDIWSYGVVLFEIWSRGEVPFEGFDNLSVCEMLLHQRKPTHFMSVSMRDHVRALLSSCWRYQPHTRPLFTTIMKHFEVNENISAEPKTNGEAKGKGKRKKKTSSNKKNKNGEKKEGEKAVSGDEEKEEKKTDEADKTEADKKEADKETDGGSATADTNREITEDGSTTIVVSEDEKTKNDLGYASDGNTLIECS